MHRYHADDIKPRQTRAERNVRNCQKINEWKSYDIIVKTL